MVKDQFLDLAISGFASSAIFFENERLAKGAAAPLALSPRAIRIAPTPRHPPARVLGNRLWEGTGSRVIKGTSSSWEDQPLNVKIHEKINKTAIVTLAEVLIISSGQHCETQKVALLAQKTVPRMKGLG